MGEEVVHSGIAVRMVKALAGACPLQKALELL